MLPTVTGWPRADDSSAASAARTLSCASTDRAQKNSPPPITTMRDEDADENLVAHPIGSPK